MTSQYERDFHAWAGEQAGLLRAGKLAEADLLHIIGPRRFVAERHEAAAVRCLYPGT